MSSRQPTGVVLVGRSGSGAKGRCAPDQDSRHASDVRLTAGHLEVHPRVAMAILRHSRIALTMDSYTQVPDKTTREALQRLSDLLDDHQGDRAAPGGDEAADGLDDGRVA